MGRLLLIVALKVGHRSAVGTAFLKQTVLLSEFSFFVVVTSINICQRPPLNVLSYFQSQLNWLCYVDKKFLFCILSTLNLCHINSTSTKLLTIWFETRGMYCDKRWKVWKPKRHLWKYQPMWAAGAPTKVAFLSSLIKIKATSVVMEQCTMG